MELYSKKSPLTFNKKLKDEKERSEQDLKIQKLSYQLGQHQGTMSNNFREFVFAEVGALSWVGEESMFTENFQSSYSVRTKTVVTVLEFATSDLRDILRNVYRDYMQEVALKKHILLLERIKEIVKSSKSLFE